MSKKTTKKTAKKSPVKSAEAKAKAEAKKDEAKKKADAKKQTQLDVKKTKELKCCTYIDRSNGILLREKDLNKKKPWISPVSGQATVEKLTEVELKALAQV
ncbi:hypothetical protein LCGC14_1583360 [marine sediment metagenome]|uniref:Uncharacterized protein n=1 Tax=marine sediment metagenome TaxID=412755 RepID=A0A0F9IGG6_9ZZZZ